MVQNVNSFPASRQKGKSLADQRGEVHDISPIYPHNALMLIEGVDVQNFYPQFHPHPTFPYQALLTDGGSL
jgi:hypothetical protein